MSKLRKFLDFIWFEISWFACLLGAAKDIAYVGIVCVLLFLFYCLVLAKDFKKELFFIFIAAFVGVSSDLIAVYVGAFSFEGEFMGFGKYPLWMLALWISFLCIVNTSLEWLKGRYLMISLLGVFGAPASYLAGSNLGPISLNQDIFYALTVIAVIWAVVGPLIFFIARKVEEVQ